MYLNTSEFIFCDTWWFLVYIPIVEFCWCRCWFVANTNVNTIGEPVALGIRWLFSSFLKVVQSSSQSSVVILCDLQIQTSVTSHCRKTAQSAVVQYGQNINADFFWSLKARFLFWSSDQVMPSTRNYFPNSQ